jgi:dTDP-4-amino-4,6-dideoxygalactose transaminase
LQDIDGLKLLPKQDIKQNYAYYPVLVDEKAFGINRDGLCEKLKEKGVFARKYFYPLVSENKAFGMDLTKATPNAKYYSENVVCLPLYADLDLADVDMICEIIKG